jgi:magnesium-transporting ATPase (P-type)
MSIAQVATKHGTQIDLSDPSKSFGLSVDTVNQRQKEEGKNAISPPKKKPLWLLYLSHFTQLFNVMLVVSGVLSLILFFIDRSSNINVNTKI